MKERLFALSILLATTHISSALSTATEIIISVPDQQLALIDRGKLISKYTISTSRFGLGDGNGTYRTPRGTLFVSAKFGDHLPAGAVIKNRVPTGEIVNANAPGRDAIVSRVIGLRGMEQAKQRRTRSLHLYPRHAGGTPNWNSASFGCIRMRSHDVIALYDLRISACMSRSRQNESPILFNRKSRACWHEPIKLSDEKESLVYLRA